MKEKAEKMEKKPIDCETYQVWINDWLDGTLDQEKEALLQAHSKLCPACREEWNLARKVQETLHQLPDVEMPPLTRARAFRSLQKKRRLPYVRIASLAASLMLCVGLLWSAQKGLLFRERAKDAPRTMDAGGALMETALSSGKSSSNPPHEAYDPFLYEAASELENTRGIKENTLILPMGTKDTVLILTQKFAKNMEVQGNKLYVEMGSKQAAAYFTALTGETQVLSCDFPLLAQGEEKEAFLRLLKQKQTKEKEFASYLAFLLEGKEEMTFLICWQ